jgi:phosphatidylglycerophosphate synthase
MPDTEANRRPIASRSAQWAKASASFLARTSVTPNQISATSVVFAAAGAALLAFKPDAVGLIGCAIAVQARLVCNLLDGMVAIEGGKKSAVGALYNEFPDRIADSLLIVALGYGIGWPALGWFGALVAALTAYIRVFGGSLGLAQDFRGRWPSSSAWPFSPSGASPAPPSTCLPDPTMRWSPPRSLSPPARS